jgi:hypothetical protein
MCNSASPDHQKLAASLKETVMLGSERTFGMGLVTIYYVNCERCKREIEIDRKPRGESITTEFGTSWTVRINCDNCDAIGYYTRNDVLYRYERSISQIEP